MNADAGTGANVTLAIGAALLMLICFFCGGNSAEGNLGLMAASLLALPILFLAVFRSGQVGYRGLARWSLIVVAMIVMVPLLQLLPMPEFLWNLPAARPPLMQDLEAAGVLAFDRRWSLTPGATERDLWFLLPGVALFVCMLAIGRTGWHRMLWLVMFLAVANLIFALALHAAGKDSALNPYPDFAPAWGGIFANSNHQADLLAVGLMLALMFLARAWRPFRENRHVGVECGALLALTLILAIALPVVGSRAGVIVAMIMVMGVLLGSGAAQLRSLREHRVLQVAIVLGLIVFVIGLQAAVGWLKIDAGNSAIEGSRGRMLSETLQVGGLHAPLGAGLGSFIPAYQQGTTDDALMNVYVNNAHNDFAQWWLEGGIAGIAVALLALIVLFRTLVRLLRLPATSKTRTCGLAAMMGIGVIVLHSTVDYPLRAPALMAIFAVLSGIAVAAASAGLPDGSLSLRRRRDIRSGD